MQLKNFFTTKLIIFLIISVLVLSTFVYAEESEPFIVRVESKEAKPGERVKLDVFLENNSGIVSLNFSVDHDRDRLKLVGVTDGGIVDGAVFGDNLDKVLYKMLWLSASYENFCEDGTLVTLEFEVKEDAKPGDAHVRLLYHKKNIFDVDLNNVDITVVDGGIKVTSPDGEGLEDSAAEGTGQDKAEDQEGSSEDKVFFSDVKEEDWFYENVKYVLNNGLMNGVSEDKFSPEDNVTRAMFVTVLYRMEGEPEASDSGFSDVEKGSWYESAVSWANSNGIVNGASETSFEPDSNITREQMAAIIKRYAAFKGLSMEEGENTNILSYEDFAEIDEYAIEAFQYVCGSGILKGLTESKLGPKENATRAQAAAIFMRTAELIK